MKLLCFAVRDSALQAFNRPFFMATVAQANRSFADEVNREDPQSDLFKHPEDFELYVVGGYDDETGMLSPQPPALVARGKDLRAAPKE